MTRKVHHTDNAPAAIGPYSQAIEASGTMVFCSGQIPLLPDGTLLSGSVAEQTEQVMKNIDAVLTGMGLSFGNVVKTTIFLSSMDHFATVNEIYGKAFPSDPPARSTVAVAGLPKNVDVEIEVIAMR
ncbi:MAG: RidA family protein [Armatimonadetes bacterium]|nr:RidA family protein [Armatimonadota bacterium]